MIFKFQSFCISLPPSISLSLSRSLTLSFSPRREYYQPVSHIYVYGCLRVRAFAPPCLFSILIVSSPLPLLAQIPPCSRRRGAGGSFYLSHNGTHVHDEDFLNLRSLSARRNLVRIARARGEDGVDGDEGGGRKGREAGGDIFGAFRVKEPRENS